MLFKEIASQAIKKMGNAGELLCLGEKMAA